MAPARSGSVWVLLAAVASVPYSTGLQPLRTVPRHHLRAEAFGGLSCGAFKLQQLQGGTQAQRVASLLDGREDDEAGALSDDEVRAR